MNEYSTSNLLKKLSENELEKKIIDVISLDLNDEDEILNQILESVEN